MFSAYYSFLNYEFKVNLVILVILFSLVIFGGLKCRYQKDKELLVTTRSFATAV